MIIRIGVGPVLFLTVVGIAEAVIVDDEVAKVIASLGDEGGVVGFGNGVVDGIRELDLEVIGLGPAVRAGTEGLEALQSFGSGGGFGSLGAGPASGGRRVLHRFRARWWRVELVRMRRGKDARGREVAGK